MDHAEQNRRWQALVESLVARAGQITDAEMLAELAAESGESEEELTRLQYVHDIRRRAKTSV